MQLTNHRHQSFISWNPYSQQDENHDCGICHETFEEHPFTADNIAIKHKGENGQKHPAVHLKCMKIWLETSNLCAYCQSPLNVQQLSLFSDILEEIDLTQFNLTRLLECAKEAEQIASTPAGILKSIKKPIRKETKHLEKTYQNFIVDVNAYGRALNQAIESLEEMLDTTSENDYYNSKKSLLQLEETDLIRLGANYEKDIQPFQTACEAHHKASEIYLLNERLLYHLNPITEEYLTALSHTNPLLLSSQEEMQEIGNMSSQWTSTFSLLRKEMNKFKDKYTNLKDWHHITINMKIASLFAMIIFLPLRFTLKEECSITSPQNCFYFFVLLPIACIMTPYVILTIFKNHSWIKCLKKRFICKIELPARQVYKAVEFIWKADA